MPSIELFPKNQVVGIFRGFQQGGLEFHADLVLPYRNDFQNIPMHGQFILVQLETPDEAVLGRITSFSSEGKLAFGSGEEFNLRAVKEERVVPEDLREQYLKYRVNIRVLGVIRRNGGEGLTFVPSHRRLPHVGSPVAFPSEAVMQEIAGHNAQGVPIGYLAFGEYIYAKDKDHFDHADREWVQLLKPETLIKFPIDTLVSRRTFVFARAGFGKSNLNKLLFSLLYSTKPTVEKRKGKKVPVGTVVFDPDGEYFWPDDKGRPGLCDVPALQDSLVVFTPRVGPSPFYNSFVAGGIKLDIRRMRPADVIAIALPPDQQERQNVSKLKGLSPDRWSRLVDLIDGAGNSSSLSDIGEIMGIDDTGRQEVEVVAARSNMTKIVRMLHDRSSQLIDKLIYALSQGKLCVIDVSQMRSGQSLVLSGLILRRIFDRNQEEFTKADPQTIPTIAVVEEAQSVLNDRASAATPYVEWVKEGRKYDLGALLITQQPGSLPMEILSQGDNWFIFHLLSSSDLGSLKKANAHFSDDLLSSLLNEPLPGQGIFWSSVKGKPYPVSLRVLSFEKMYSPIDKDYNMPAVDTFAKVLLEEFKPISATTTEVELASSGEADALPKPEEAIDFLAAIDAKAIEALRGNEKLKSDMATPKGAVWMAVHSFLKDQLPEKLDDRDQHAHQLVSRAMNSIYGAGGWRYFKGPNKAGDRQVSYISTHK